MVSDGRAGRRKWTSEQKQRIVDETRAPGASVSVVARRYDINANLLFKWKRQEEAGGLAVPSAPEFVPIGVVGRANDGGPALLARAPDDEPRNQVSGWPEGEVRRPSGLECRTGVIDGSGLCLFAKRLERGRFVWPPIVDGALVLTPAQLALLIEAIDWRRTVAPPLPARPTAV
jgi:transposase-like protein